MSFWKNLEKGDFKGAYNNLVGAITDHLPSSLNILITRLMSDEGQVAYQVALDAWNNWADEGTPLLEVAKNAASKALQKGLTVAEKDIADWLGIIDRNT